MLRHSSLFNCKDVKLFEYMYSMLQRELALLEWPLEDEGRTVVALVSRRAEYQQSEHPSSYPGADERGLDCVKAGVTGFVAMPRRAGIDHENHRGRRVLYAEVQREVKRTT
jgi:hypothetical protein